MLRVNVAMTTKVFHENRPLAASEVVCKDYTAAIVGGQLDVGLGGAPVEGALPPIKKRCSETNIVEGQLDVGLGGTPVEGVLPPIKKCCSERLHISNLRVTQVPTFCHTFASKKGLSSRRTRAAAGSFLNSSVSQLLPRNTVRKRIKSWCRKQKKQKDRLLFIRTTPEMGYG